MYVADEILEHRYNLAKQWRVVLEEIAESWPSYHLWVRVVPSEIQNLERQRGQYQVSWVFGGLSKRNVASKPRSLRNVWKEPYRGFGFVTCVTF